jgi:predicted alpha/beta hydrolase
VCTLFRVLPRWTGLAGPLPQGVAREWARWGRSQNWYLSQEPESADLLARFSAPILAYGVSDDLIAPPRAVTAFLDQFAATAPIRRNVDPRQIGLGKIGHVGLLRPSQEIEVIWQEILDFLRREAVQGETSDCVELSNQRARA